MGGLPVSLGVVGSAFPFLSILSTLAVLLVAGSGWLLARRRAPRLGLAFLALMLAGVAGSWVPTYATGVHAEVAGTLTGEARFEVLAAPGTPVDVRGGEGSLVHDTDGTRLVLSCPAGCSFRVGAEPGYGKGPSARFPEGDSVLGAVEGGPLEARSTVRYCQRLPFALRPFASAGGCLTCYEDTLRAGPDAPGERRFPVARGPVC